MIKAEPLGREYTRCITLSPNGRLYELMAKANQLECIDQGSWARLLKTQEFNRRQALVKKMRRHFEWLLKKRIPNIDNWIVEMTGSVRSVDVRAIRKQRYRLIFTVR